jgi:hypothetical protein
VTPPSRQNTRAKEAANLLRVFSFHCNGSTPGKMSYTVSGPLA